MNFYDILTEARIPNHINTRTKISNPKKRILLEAEDDEKAKDEDNKPENDEKAKDESSDNDEENDSNDEIDFDNTDAENNDDTPPDDGGMDMDNNNTVPEDDIDPAHLKNKTLMNNSIELYYSIKKVLNKLDLIDSANDDKHAIILTVKNNCITLLDLLTSFITETFKSNTYVKNLYLFNYFIQTYTININILEKINVF